MNSSNRGSEGQDSVNDPVPEYIDWIAGVIIVLAGMALLVGGSVLSFVVDRDQLEENVESGQITVVTTERELTEAEMLEFIQEVVSWIEIGLSVTGLGLVLFAIGYVIVRHRTHRQIPDNESASSYRSNAVLGAVITMVLSFIPFSAVLGGGAAGYFEQKGSRRSASVGAFSGILAMLPVLIFLVFVTVGMYTGLSTIQEADLGLVTTAVMLCTLLVVGVYGAGLGALGGFAGGRFAKD